MAVGAVAKRPLPVTNVIVGRVGLTAGAADVDMNEITEDSLIFLSGNSGASSDGALTATITAGDKFAIASSDGTNDGYVSYMVVINPLNP